MRIRQVGFSSRLKAHKKILTLETLKFIVEFIEDGDARQAALRSGVPEQYASRQGHWLKKHLIVRAVLEKEVEIEPREKIQLKKALIKIQEQMDLCKNILGLEEY